MLADSRDVAAYYDDVVAAGADPKVAANWVMGEIMAHLKQEKAAITEIQLSAVGLAELLALIAEGAISGKVGACCCAPFQAPALDWHVAHRRSLKTSFLRSCKMAEVRAHLSKPRAYCKSRTPVHWRRSFKRSATKTQNRCAFRLFCRFQDG